MKIIGVVLGALLAVGLLSGPGHAAAAATAPGAQPASGVFLQLTDIHFTPFSDAKTLAKLVASPIEDWPAILSAAPATIAGPPDTDYRLLTGALANARLRGRYDVVINTGDHLAHSFKKTYDALGGDDAQYSQFATKTLLFIYRTEKLSFPDTPLITALGNNDDACGDYQSDQPDATTTALSEMLAPLAPSAQARQDAARIGSYLTPMPQAVRQDIIALDDVDWSSHFKTCGGADGTVEAAATLQWLARTLAAERKAGRTAILIMHIPPGVDPFSTRACPATATPFWTRPALDGFVALVAKYRDVVKVAIAGHTHMNDFRVVTAEGEPVTAVRISPAVTPLFGNHASYTVFKYHRRSGVIEDYATWSLPNRAQAAEPSAWVNVDRFSATYGSPDFTPRTVFDLVSKIRAGDGALRKSYENHFAAGGTSAITSTNWNTYSCAQTALADPQFTACRCP